MSPATSETRELAARDSDGIHVRLLWHPQQERAHRVGRGRPCRRSLPARVAPDRALDAFYHPFAYAACRVEDLSSR